MMSDAVKKAIDIIGGQKKLGEAVNRSQQTVSLWLGGAKIPPEIAKRIEEATGGAVTRAELRPDIFG